jgi:type I restriction enzyme S subunit
MAYVQLGDICNIVKGEIGITKAIPGDYPMVTTGEFRKSHNKFQLETKAILVPLVSATGHGHASIKRIHYQEGKFAFGSILAACIPKNENYSAKFLYIYFNLMKDYVLVPLMKGSANVSLTLGNLKKAKVPNISLEKQLKIVELYSEIKIEQDKAVDLLVNQKDDIASLRQAILEEALDGKLTAVWRSKNTNTEPVSELLKHIQAEKDELIAQKKIKNKHKLHQKAKKEPTFHVPDSWEIRRFWDVIWCYRGHNPPKSKFIDSPREGYVRFVQITDFKTDNRAVYVPKSHKLKRVKKGEILMAAYRHIGKLSRDMEGAFNVALCKVNCIKPYNIDFLEMLIGSKLVKGELLAESGRSHIPSMHSDHLLSLWIPIPPIEEQKVIVKEVNALMSLCNSLEQEIKQSQENSEQLMRSTLREVFEGKKAI